MTTTTQVICHYHQAESGEAYYATGACRSTPVVKALPDLLQSLPDVATMRVIGVAENAEFILRCRKSRPDISLEIGGPGLCVYTDELRKPEIVIQRMRQSLLSPSLGGFHRCAYPDLAAYRLVQFVKLDAMHWTERVKSAAMAHPAWDYLPFMPTFFAPAAACLLATLIDPRWFVDPHHPDRINRVKSFLGLSPAIQRRVVRGDISDDATRRCALVLACWSYDAPEDPDVGAPGNFLWRIRDAASDLVIGDLRASQAFVTYLIRTWQARIAKETLRYLKEPLFVPERFFRSGDVDEVQAYNDFAAKFRHGPQDIGSE